MHTIADRLAAVRERIERATLRSQRPPNSVRLIAVSKTVPLEAIAEAYRAGQRDFGENYVQELVSKREELADLPDLRWHMIGHVQRNKARHLVSGVAMIHTLSSADLARELGKRRGALEPREPSLPVLVEVNIGREPQKSGCTPEALGDVLAAIDEQPTLALRGLMTVPPHTATPDAALPFFEALRTLRDAHGGSTRLPELSMGMSFDLEQAIVAGATLVRVGTLIFGERPVKA